MKLTDMPTPELLDVLRATEALAGPDAIAAVIIRREILRRCDQAAPDLEVPADER